MGTLLPYSLQGRPFLELLGKGVCPARKREPLGAESCRQMLGRVGAISGLRTNNATRATSALSWERAFARPWTWQDQTLRVGTLPWSFQRCPPPACAGVRVAPSGKSSSGESGQGSGSDSHARLLDSFGAWLCFPWGEATSAGV